MILTIELPESVVARVAALSKEELSQIAVDAVVRRLLEEPDASGSWGEFGPVTEEIPLDEATIAALKEARADFDAGRFCTLEELDARLDATLAAWKQERETK